MTNIKCLNGEDIRPLMVEPLKRNCVWLPLPITVFWKQVVKFGSMSRQVVFWSQKGSPPQNSSKSILPQYIIMFSLAFYIIVSVLRWKLRPEEVSLSTEMEAYTRKGLPQY